MPPCFTCGQEIIFDPNIRSKNGKQIPLWPDGKNTHGHDDNGQPVRGDLPEGAKPKSTPTFQPKPFKPNSWRNTPLDKNNTVTSVDTDTKIERITAQLFQLNQTLDSIANNIQYLIEITGKNHNEVKEITHIDTNKLIGQQQQIHDVIAPFLNTQIKAASEIYQNETKEQKFKREQEEQKKWNIDDNKIPDDDSYKTDDSATMEGVQED